MSGFGSEFSVFFVNYAGDYQIASVTCSFGGMCFSGNLSVVGCSKSPKPALEDEMEFSTPAVAAAFDSYPEEIRRRLLQLRALIFEVAQATDGVGKLTETLKWGEPAYLTEQTKSGSTVRLGKTKTDGEAAVFFICHTGLVSRFREIFPEALSYQGTRAIVFGRDDEIDKDALAQCLAMAFTFKRK